MDILKRNNPGNIRKAASFMWQGEQPGLKPGSYVIFDTLENGYRAELKLIQNYVKNGFNTISKILYRWAPPSDNNPTDGYIKFVSDNSGIGKDDVLKPTDADSITQIAYFMSRFEHGVKDNSRELFAIANEVKKKFFGIVETAIRTASENPKKTGLLLITGLAALIYFNHE